MSYILHEGNNVVVQREQGMETKGEQKDCSSEVTTDVVILLHMRTETANLASKLLNLTNPCDHQQNTHTVSITFYHQVPSSGEPTKLKRIQKKKTQFV